MKKSYCIVCGKEKKGIAIREDAVLDVIRWVKKNVTKNEKGNALVVCKDDYAAYRAARKRYVNRQRIYVALGALFVVLTVAIYPRAETVLVSILVFAFVVLLSLLNYTPGISIKTA